MKIIVIFYINLFICTSITLSLIPSLKEIHSGQKRKDNINTFKKSGTFFEKYIVKTGNL